MPTALQGVQEGCKGCDGAAQFLITAHRDMHSSTDTEGLAATKLKQSAYN